MREEYSRTYIDYLIENYEKYTDVYFLRSKHILQREKINPLVRYQIFARKDTPNLKGVNEVINFLGGVVGNKIKVWHSEKGSSYQAGKPLMKLEGRLLDLIDLETVCLGILSGRNSSPVNLEEIKKNADNIVKTASEKKVYYFGARHFLPRLDEAIAHICYEAGFSGASTDIGASSWNRDGVGTIPHALIIACGIHSLSEELCWNPTVAATKLFDSYMDLAIPRVALIDTFNRESFDAIEVGKELSNLSAVRIDTCGENSANTGLEKLHVTEAQVTLLGRRLEFSSVKPHYLYGKGVTVRAVWGLRRDLDESGLGHIDISISSGFNSEKIAVFVKADKLYQDLYGKSLFDSVGTGSLGNPTMVTSDIVAYFDEESKCWKPYSKVGRSEAYWYDKM